MERECSGHGSAGVVISFLAGGLIGAATAMLLAPKSGKETREQIKSMADEVKETTTDYYERVKKIVVSALENGQELLEEKKDLIASAVQAGIETYEKKRKKQDKNAKGDVESSPD
jgi:gas vesicle protein